MTLSPTDPTPCLVPLQTHLTTIDYPLWRKDLTGYGVRLVVIDKAFNYDHETLKRNLNIERRVMAYVGSTDHGTAVLGVVSGTYTIRGMCPQAAVTTKPSSTLQDSIQTATAELSAGDVVMVQATLGFGQDDGTPVESMNYLFDAIKACTDKGIIFIEPAGNSNTDLDATMFLRKFDPTFRDSGAIMVAAASRSRDVHRIIPTNTTSFGSRIDVCAPGEGVLTCGYGDYISSIDKDRRYTMFGGTSSAAAIVAGACACLNSARIAAGKAPYGAQEMRSVLRQSGTDTDKSIFGNVPIGKLINVRQALAYAVPSPDLDGDGIVGLGDFFLFSNYWNNGDQRADFDGDGKVSMSDFWMLAKGFGRPV